MTVWAAGRDRARPARPLHPHLAIIVAVVATVNLVVAAPLAAHDAVGVHRAERGRRHRIGSEAGGVNPDRLPFRMTALGVVVACLFGALFVRLWYLQVLNSNQFQVAAQHNGVRSLYTPAPRGRILDRNGKVLVDNQLHRRADRRPADDRQAPRRRSSMLAAVLERGAEASSSPSPTPATPTWPPCPIVRAQRRPDHLRQGAQPTSSPTCRWPSRSCGTYPYGDASPPTCSATSGRSTPPSCAPRRARATGQATTIGKAGVELAYESAAARHAGRASSSRSTPTATCSARLDTQAPVQGHDVRLSDRPDIQKLAEDSLQRGPATARATVDRDQELRRSPGKTYPAPAGAVVVLDPGTARSWPCASQPDLQPDAVRQRSSRPANYDSLTSPSQQRAVRGPGDVGPLRAGVDVQAGDGDRRPRARLITPDDAVRRQGLHQGRRRRTSATTAAEATAMSISTGDHRQRRLVLLHARRRASGRTGVARRCRTPPTCTGSGRRPASPSAVSRPGVVPDPTTRRKEKDEYPTLFETADVVHG